MRRCSALVMFLFCLSLSLSAQEADSAVISGLIKDPSGAVLRMAAVEARNSATNVSRVVKTNGSGTYVISGLPPGEYEITVSANGYAQASEKMELAVGQTRALDFVLKIGAEKQVIEVSSSSAQISTVSSVVDAVIDSHTIDQLPLNGRNYLELALLVPGNSPAPNFDPTKTNTVLISSAGQLGRGGNVTIDGADNNDDVVGGSLYNLPEDAVREFQIATNRFSAELGRSGSSVINVVTKSGTNSLHGSASAYERDRVLQGLPATFDRSLGKTPPFSRQQYSATLGGPIVQDKAWWFAGFEYRNQDGAVLVGRRDVPTHTIQKTFAPAPLTDLLFTPRLDWRVSDRDTLSFRYSLDRSDATDASTLVRAIGSASARQDGQNHFQAVVANWTRVISNSLVNQLSVSENNFINVTSPVQPGVQLTFPSLQDGASFRVPQQTRQKRFQTSDTLSWTRGKHSFRFGGEVQRIGADFNLGVFQSGRIEFLEDFAPFDRNGDGLVNDDDLLFAVTLRSAFPNRPLIIPNDDNNHLAFFAQDDWRVHPQFVFNLGLRYELDTDVKDIGHLSQLNPLILPFLKGKRGKDTDNFGPRVGFNWSTRSGKTSVHGGYGIYYDRVTLEINSLERGLDGRALPVEVRGGNVFFLTPAGTFAPGAPTVASPFTGPIFPGAGAGGINIIDNNLQNPMVQQFDLGFQQVIGTNLVAQADYIHDLGTHFIIGRSIGTVFNPVVGGQDVVKNLESSVNTKYDGLLLSLQKRFSDRYQFRASYTLSKAFNYANDDQIPFANGPLDPNNLRREYGPTPNDQRHRFVFSGAVNLPYGFNMATLWTLASAVPMDILLPDASSRVPAFQRNAGGRAFHTASELNAALTALNAGQPVAMQLPLVSPGAKFGDNFNSLDLRLAKEFKIHERLRLQALAEALNILNITNILGVSNLNYSGFNNVLARDSNDPANPGYLKSSSFGRPVSTAGGVFGQGGPRAFQLALKLSF